MAFGYIANTGDALTWARRSARRKIFHDLPNGPTSLVGILALNDNEITDNNEFEWEEKRWTERVLYLASFSGADGPFMNGASGGSTDTTFEVTSGSTLRVAVTTNKSIDDVRPSEMITFLRLPTSSGFVDLTIQVTSVDTVTGIITAVARNTISSASTGTLTNTLATLVTIQRTGIFGGVAHAEGALSGSMRRPTWPLSITNYCQIFRNAFKFSSSQLEVPQIFNPGGLYETTARDCCVDHHVEMENAVLFGEKFKETVVDPDDGSDTVRRSMGGITYYLKQWELSGGGTFGYRPGGAALTALADDDKRIWDAGASGQFSDSEWDFVLQRIFRKCFTSSHEKLLIGGDGVIAAINKKYRGQIQMNTDMVTDHKISYYLHTVQTEYGTLHFRAHSRFNAMPHMRYDALTLDLPNLRLRPLNNRDTKLRPKIHRPDFDGRKDEYLTEIGLELRFPESHGWLRNLRTIAS